MQLSPCKVNDFELLIFYCPRFFVDIVCQSYKGKTFQKDAEKNVSAFFEVR